MTSPGCRCGYDDGRFILHVVGSVSSATGTLNSVFQPSPVPSEFEFHVLGEHRLVVRVQQLVVVLAHDIRGAEQVLLLHALERQRDLQCIGGAGLVDRAGQHVELRDAGKSDEAEVVRCAPALEEFRGLGVVLLHRDVLMVFHDRGKPAFAVRADRRRGADYMRKIGVVADIQPGIDAGLDQQVEVGPVVPGDQRLRAGRLDLGDIRRKILDLHQRDELVGDDLDVGTILAEEPLGVLLDRLAEQVVLVQQIDRLDRLRQRLDPRHRAHLHAADEAEMPEAALLVGKFGRQLAAVQLQQRDCPDCACCAWSPRRSAPSRHWSRRTT